jgi:hypothetical protein
MEHDLEQFYRDKIKELEAKLSQGQTMTVDSSSDLKRIEDKLDRILQYIGIGIGTKTNVTSRLDN